MAWAAAPPRPTGLADIALFLAVVCVTASALRLALADVPQPEERYFLPAWELSWIWFLTVFRLPPWEEVAVVVILWLEVLHPARPWHTAVLGAGLVAYLLAVQLAESGASPAALRPQGRALAAGACLLAPAAGAAMLPAATPGGGSALLRLLAAGAVVAAAGLVLPAL